MTIPTLHRLTCTVLTAAALLIPAAAQAQRADGSFERTLTVTERPDIEIESGSGSIEVRQGGAGRVEVRGRIRATDWGWRRGRYSVEERIKLLEATPPVTQTGNAVRIGHIADDGSRNGVSITYEVIVPATSVLGRRPARDRSASKAWAAASTQAADQVRSSCAAPAAGSRRARDPVESRLTRSAAIDASTGSGSIAGTGIGGAIRVHTSSGGIEVTQTAAGDVDASSSSGTVRVRGVNGGLRASTSSGGLHVEGQMAREWRLSSSSGHVTIDVPGSQGLEVDANSNSGSIDVDFPVTVTGTVGKRTLRGSARGGGPLLYVRTSSGGISIQ